MLSKRISAVALVAIVGLAIYLRVANIDAVEFKRDEAALSLLTLDLIDGRRIPLSGIATSVRGLDNGPLMVYLLALPYAVARDPALASSFVALLNVAALLVSARLTERAFGRLAALFAAASYAAGSWAVLFSRKLWPNDAMPLFSAMLGVALYAAVVGGRPAGFVVAGACLGALLNLHPSGIMFVPVVLLALLMRPGVLRTPAPYLSAALALLISLPFLYGQWQRGFSILQAIESRSERAAIGPAATLEQALRLVGPDAYLASAAPAQGELIARSISSGALHVVLPMLLAMGVLIATLQLGRALIRRSGWRGWALALTWLAAPLGIASVGAVDPEPHYLIALLPLMFPFVGLALATPVRLVRLAPLPLRAPAIALPIAVVLWGIVVQVQHFAAFFETVRSVGGRTAYGVPLLHQQTAANRALQYAGNRTIALISQAPPRMPSTADDLPPIWRFLVPEPNELRFEDGGGGLRLTADGALYVVAPGADPIVGELLTTRGRSAGRGVALPGLERGYEYWRASAAPPTSDQIVARLENGLRLENVDHPARIEPGHPVPLVASWRVERQPADDDLAFFMHLLDDRGERRGGVDRSGLHPGVLTAGDEVITWAQPLAPADLAPGRYWIALGMYRTDGVERLMRTDDAAPSERDHVVVGPLKVAFPDAPPSGEQLATFESRIALEQASVPPGGRAGEKVSVELIWRAGMRPAGDFTIFVHALDATGSLIGQSDQQPAGGTYPTSIWDQGERVLDNHELALPAGRYRILVGIYDASTLRRLPVVGAQRDYVEVGSVEIEP